MPDVLTQQIVLAQKTVPVTDIAVPASLITKNTAKSYRLA